ncbi:diaminopimelate epimerase [Lentisphaerota bacterium ZTH]|nr:diaminopimelate epimerase [Lentisphaerota bacterium]WET07346.1 diaminopimelate epimerase [Lentisphaerota bacterium ZTH]
MNVEFIKMHGIGNDYIYFDCIADPDLITQPEKIAPQLSDRHCGIGGDGIVLILKDDEADYCMRMFNADGSEAEMCGNAIRCVAKYLCDKEYITGNEVTIQSGAGIKHIEIIRDTDGAFHYARVDMGEPELKGLFIPVNVDTEPVIDVPVSVSDGTEYKFTCVSMGNPHAVTFVDEITDQQVLQHGPELEVDKMFPAKINVEFVKVLSPSEVDMRVWERGSGETMACGTGASAVAVACVLKKHTGRKVLVHLRGGDLEIEWAENNHVYMTGPATTAFTGTVEI